jgi:hypothetical protein
VSLGFLGYSLALLLAAAIGDGRATVSPIAFDLSRGPGAEQCPDHDTLAIQLASRLAEAMAPVGSTVVSRVTIDIERTVDGHVARITALGLEGGVRRLVDNSENCAGLAEALVLTLSLIADGRPVSPANALPLQPASPSTRAPMPWQLGASAVVSTGILGAHSAGVSLDGVGHPSPRVVVAASAQWMPTRSFEQAGGTVSLTVLAAVARLCGGIIPFGRRVFPVLCWEAGAGGLRGAGQGYAGAQTVWSPWLVTGGSAALELRVHPGFSLAARVGYLFSLRDTHFSIGDVGRVYDSGHPGWTGGLVALVRIR